MRLPFSGRVLLGALVVVAVGLAVGGIGQARAGGGPNPFAGRTVTGSFPIEDHIDAIQPESSICGFDVRLDQTGTGQFEVLLDANGNFVRGHVLINVTGTVSANGKTLQVLSADNLLFTATPGQTEVGLAFQMFLPGLGVVLWGRGRLVFDADGNIIFDAGSHPEPEGDVETIERVCAALAP